NACSKEQNQHRSRKCIHPVSPEYRRRPGKDSQRIFKTTSLRISIGIEYEIVKVSYSIFYITQLSHRKMIPINIQDIYIRFDRMIMKTIRINIKRAIMAPISMIGSSQMT